MSQSKDPKFDGLTVKPFNITNVKQIKIQRGPVMKKNPWQEARPTVYSPKDSECYETKAKVLVEGISKHAVFPRMSVNITKDAHTWNTEEEACLL